MVVSLAFLYNFWVIIYRFAFQEINVESIVVWFCLDYFSDFLYLVDILFHFRTGYLEDGVLQTDSTKLRQHYMNSTTFYIDCLCLLPLDFLYLSIGFNSILRSFRLVKIYRFWAFMDRTERHTNYPNLFRSTSLIHYLLVIFHWNGCLYHIIYKNNGFGSKNWVFHDSESADVVKQYLQSYYWCTLALTTIGDLPRPRPKAEYVFVIAQLLFGLLLFATVLGHVANIVTSVSAARKEFQGKLATELVNKSSSFMWFIVAATYGLLAHKVASGMPLGSQLRQRPRRGSVKEPYSKQQQSSPGCFKFSTLFWQKMKNWRHLAAITSRGELKEECCKNFSIPTGGCLVVVCRPFEN